MRSGACTVQNTLTTEAASVLKHSLSLARRRGHAQVTPLHVAATLLSSRASVLRRACFKSQPHHTSHPLELCFNVALNKLPATPGSLLHAQPSLSNALIAALKRAQARQRRGCIEQQQQPLLAIKVELELLIISILDDPTVSRVMREAGFSSTSVKNNIEDLSPSPEIINPTSFWQTLFLTYSSEQKPFLLSPEKKVSANNVTESASIKEDIKLVFKVLLRKKRNNTVIVGDCVSTTEGLVSELTSRIKRGDVPDEMKHVHLIKFYFAPVSLRFMKREDVEKHLADLKRKLDSIAFGGDGAIIYTGDLKWTAEEIVNVPGNYSPVDHLVTEIGNLLSDCNFSNTKVWLLATASYQTYLKCQMRQPPLETQWALQAVSVPSGGLGLSLHASSFNESRMSLAQNASECQETKPFSNNKEDHDKLSCCGECTSNYEKDVELFKSGQQQSLLPPWLQSHGNINAGQKDELIELRRKWNTLCHSLHQNRHNQNNSRSTMFNDNHHSLTGKIFPHVSSYHWWPCQAKIFPDSASISFSDASSRLNLSSNSVPKFRRQNSCTIEFNFGCGGRKQKSDELNLDSLKNSDHEDKEVKITLALGNSLKQTKGKTNEVCKSLIDNVPWQSEFIPSIAEALVDSKSTKKQTWFLIQGNDVIGKRRLARAIAESVFGSADLLLRMNMNKLASSCSETLLTALKNKERLVILVENVDLADTQFLKLLSDGFETGIIGESADQGKDYQAIFILTKSISSKYEDENQHQNSVIEMKQNANEKNSSLITINSDIKRKAEWDVSGRTKYKTVKMVDEVDQTSSCIRKDLSSQSSFNILDLNMKADEDDDENGGNPGDSSPISSDIIRETSTADPSRMAIDFLESIQNRYIFNRHNQIQGDERVLQVEDEGIHG